MITVATDGSCLGNPGPAAWAWYVDGQSWRSGSLGRATNNVAELAAVLHAARELPSDAEVLCLADSQYAIHCLTRGPGGWLAGWERSGKIGNDTKLANAALIREAVAALDARRAPWVFRWVKGHSTNELNCAVDRAANTMASRRGAAGRLAGPGWRPGVVLATVTGIQEAPAKRKPAVMTARRRGHCFECGLPVQVGAQISPARNGGWAHTVCPAPLANQTCLACQEQESALGGCGCA